MSIQSCSRPTLAYPWKGLRKRTSLMTSSLLLQQCPTCLVRLIWKVLGMGGKCPYSSYFFWMLLPGCLLMQFPSSFFSVRLVSIYGVHLYSRINMTAAWKRLCFILSDKSDFPMIDDQSIAVYAFARRKLMSFSADEMLLLRYMNVSINFREPPFRVEVSSFWLKHMYSVLSAFTRKLSYLPKPSARAGYDTRSIF